MYEVSIVLLNKKDHTGICTNYMSEDIPDLCAVAHMCTPPFEITVYDDNWDEQSIVEEHDEPGEKGNYGGIWHTITKYAPRYI